MNQTKQEARDTKTACPRRDAAVAALLIGCAVVVGFWEIMAHRSRQPFNAFELTAEDFEDFVPASRDWFVTRMPLVYDPLEPNILVHAMRHRYPDSPSRTRSVTVRLVHGYNMRDCMRIKGYGVDLVHDFRQTGLPATLREQARAEADAQPDGRVQIWRVVSDIGDAEIWITSMLQAWDFSETDVDSRSMAFPRVNVPDSQGWSPRGLTLSSFRRPVHNFRLFLRSRWNSSRNDLATFLRLRQPAWASEDVLTLVTAAHGRVMPGEEEPAVIAHALDAHLSMYARLSRWRTVYAPRAEAP